jgi:acyl-CoA thioester hydrolase
MTKSDTTHPTSGWFDGKTHVFPVRVYYEDTDFSGVVYHATYLRYMERARSEFLRLAGVHHQDMLKAEEPLVWAIRRIAIDYGKPAYIDDALTVRTQPTHLGGVRLRLSQEILRESQALTKASVEACIVTLKGEPRRVPAEIRGALAGFLNAKIA